MQLDHVKEKVLEKSNAWSKSNLSLIGRILVVNEVMLATMCHNLNCWIWDITNLRSIKAAIREYLWTGQVEDKIMARVS